MDMPCFRRETIAVLIFVSSILTSHAANHGGGCKKVVNEEVRCLDHGSALISCPEDHSISIISANIYKSSLPEYTDGCPVEHVEGTFYEIDDVTCDVQTQCSTSDLSAFKPGSLLPEVMNECSYLATVAKLSVEPEIANIYTSDPYLVIKYMCEPVFMPDLAATNAVAMAISAQRSFEGSKVHIDSSTNWLADRITQEDKKCCIYVPPNTEFHVYPYIFEKTPDDGGCSQRLNIINGEGMTYPFCADSSTPRRYACSPHTEVYELTYVTQDVTVQSTFVFNAQVPSGKDMRVECGVDVCVQPTTPSTAAPETTTTKKGDNLKSSTTTAAGGVTDTTSSVTTTSTTSGDGTPPSPSTTPGTTPWPTVTATADPGQGDTDLLPIIIGCALAALLLLIIVSILVCTRGSGATKEEIMYVQDQEDNSQITLMPMYMPDADQASSLTILKQQDPNNALYMNGYAYANPGSTLQAIPAEMAPSMMMADPNTVQLVDPTYNTGPITYA